ncbi:MULTISPECIES: ArsS family sensor histidine kinase [unclassified Campylobacter]|uniref:ArsS family sensor histidine kinase n=2 Tax=Campylobacter TaxID=194 RepID=UPI001BDA5DD8|nr:MULTISPECIES: ArsS family sensor histidine kinase [unclassified Campylobacter]MBZ7990193.1 HAMP domain-containing histidine kinase [Campylobacter sp. RM9331]MBZ7993151.1 HAMP domain-containing histidine kinase [Campylobacter sp. RM9333]MBZ8006213.1 HAMP domain-containing histidine kinase [Campylobacter sp. RM9332]MBT0883786.1 HAMP domain-containing histidine kinase [Campylobacter sp. 2018MI10]ULO03012.1 two-component system sensor histidine kinase [Campylobacter sp. RM12651]
MKSSIFYVITFIFILATSTIGMAFIWLINYDKDNYSNELNARYSYLANLKLQELNNAITEDEFNYKQNQFKLKLIDQDSKKLILFDAITLAEDSNNLGASKILTSNGKNYLYIIANDKDFLYEDTNFNSYRYMSIQIILCIVILVLLISYIFVIGKLRPIRRLKRQITKFASNDLDNIENISKGNDEISQVSDAFYQAIKKIKDLNTSRQFFLRNIMHELKTPITKGRITAEMLEDTKFKQRLINVFDRMVILIDELAAVEQITSGVAKNPKKISITHIFNEAKEMLLLENEKINIISDNTFVVYVDFKLFTTAIKNLLDNAIKYSDDNAVRVIICHESIKFYNKGKKLDKNIEYYLEPFTQGGNKSSNSFGLGLYVVNTILEAHKLKLNYNYDNGYNIFAITNLDNIIKEEKTQEK